MSNDQVQQAFASYVCGDYTAGHSALYRAGVNGIPIININNNCATGSTALYRAPDRQTNCRQPIRTPPLPQQFGGARLDHQKRFGTIDDLTHSGSGHARVAAIMSGLNSPIDLVA